MNQDSLIGLVSSARGGCRESMDRLSAKIQDELYSYIYRIVLKEDLARDLQQDTLLQMLQSVKHLQQSDRFKPWLFRIAWRKIQNHYRSLKTRRCMSLNNCDNLINGLTNSSFEGLKALVSREIADTLVQSIAAMDVRQRNALVLRCYENLPYPQIASVINCSETTARVLFFRAKQNLKAQLRKKGIVTHAMFLGLLGLFGQVTAPTKAAVSVSAATLETGAMAAGVGYAFSKMGIFLLTLTGGLGILTAFVLLNSTIRPLTQAARSSDIKSFHFIEQAWKKSETPNTNLLMGKSLSKGGYEKWFFFPEGTDGPMFLMIQRWDPGIQNKLCGWLLDGDGQKYYNSGENRVYLINSPLARKNTLRFPCDNEEMAAFLDRIEKPQEGVEYKRDPATGLLVQLRDNRFANAQGFTSDISYNKLDEKTFDAFRYNWPSAEIVDERDEIHRQGWTLVQISGTLGHTGVQGHCRIPFTYNKSREFPPLLKINIGTTHVLIDCPAGAYVLNNENNMIAAYPAGTFFKSFMRPWYGIHTVDIIRRDATRYRIAFTAEDRDYDKKMDDFRRRLITLHDAPSHPDIKIAIQVDLEMNQIETMEFMSVNTALGKLEFSYPQDPAAIKDRIVVPVIKKSWLVREKPLETLWLFKLVEEGWDEP